MLRNDPKYLFVLYTGGHINGIKPRLKVNSYILFYQNFQSGTLKVENLF